MVQCEVDNCVGSLPCGLHRELGRIGGPFVIGVVSLGAHVRNQRSRCAREGCGGVQHPVQLDVRVNSGFALVQQHNFFAAEAQ